MDHSQEALFKLSQASAKQESGYFSQSQNILQIPPNEHIYTYVLQYAQQLEPIVETFQAYIDSHLESYSNDIIIDRLNSLMQLFENQQMVKTKSCITKKKLIANEKKELVASQSKLEWIRKSKLQASSQWSYKNIMNSHLGQRTDFIGNVGLICVKKRNKRSITQEDKVAICFLIRKIIANIKNNTISTARDVYYQNIRLFKSDQHLTQLIKDICVTINVTRIDMNIVAAPKGMFYGDVTFTTDEGLQMDGSVNMGVMVPNKPSKINVLSTSAKFILIVEKYATFFQLLHAKLTDRLDCILITGCGYPDVRTRAFLQRLWLTLKLPVFALVDGDAYGIEIMCTYRYGSMSMAYENLSMNVPDIKWLGIQADDIIEFRLQGTYFKKNELKRFADLKKRQYMKDNPWMEQVNKMEQLGIKVEIQALHDYDPSFLPNLYLPYKIMYGSWK